MREIHTLRLSPVGIGIHIADRTFEVKKLVEGASAHCSGQIRVGDFLKAVDGKVNQTCTAMLSLLNTVQYFIFCYEAAGNMRIRVRFAEA